MEEDYKKWLTQFRKGYIELCTLLCLEKHKNLNGSGLLAVLEDIDISVTEGTLYPLLNRMEQNSLLESTWHMPEGSGHPKKEYKMTSKALLLLPKLKEAFNQYNKSIDKLLIKG
jgi:PadR family transcriptional regulator PadR